MIYMFRKNPVLEYESAVEGYSNIITPAKNHIPNWYKKIPKWKNNEVFNFESGFNDTVKQCMPFLDSLTSGYMIVLPNDLYVAKTKEVPFITWKNAEFPPSNRNVVTNLNLIPKGYYPLEFVWQTSAAIRVPLGYSMLFTHPINRYDLPFITLTGVIDGGLTTDPNGKIPFFIKEDFEGVIEQGTPIAQIIPFRQENWKSKKINGLSKIGYEHGLLGSLVISGWYKKTFWTRKQYD